MGNMITPVSGRDLPLQKLTIAESARRMQANQPAQADTLAVAQPSTELNPLLKNTFIGTAVGTLAGTGTALTVSQFLDDPLIALHKAKVGGIQGAVSGSVGAFAGYWTSNRTAGTVVGGIAGAGAALLQALGTGQISKGQLISSALTGFAAGAAAGNISVMLKDRHAKAHHAIEEASLSEQ